jgi:hypothetical protein
MTKDANAPSLSCILFIRITHSTRESESDREFVLKRTRAEEDRDSKGRNLHEQIAVVVLASVR